MSEAFKKQVMHDGKSNFRNGQLVPMDRPCHIYKQMWAPYCFDIKIGSERTDGLRSSPEKGEEERVGSKKKG